MTTLLSLFRDRVRHSPNRVALRDKHLGLWREYTWADYFARTRALGLGLLELGLRPGDKVGIHSEDRPEWLFAELGVQAVGGVSVGIYPTNPVAEVEYILGHAGARFLIAEDQEQVDKALAAQLPDLEHVIVIDLKGLRGYPDPRLMPLAELEALGALRHARDTGAFDVGIDAIQPDDLAALIYTSGTTGPPKGAMILHRNLTATVENVAVLLSSGGDDRLLSYLPLCHIAEKVFTIFLPIASGATANFAESIDTVFENIREVQPTIFLGVPRIWEKMAALVQVRMRDASRLKRWNFALWTRVGDRLARRREAHHGRLGLTARVRYALGWLFLYRSLRQRLGLVACRHPFSGAAPIAPEVLRFFHAIGVPIREVWGLTESCGYGTANRPDDYCVGTVGIASPSTEVRLAPDGELLIHGPTVFGGYYRAPEATAAALDAEGWLHTGDLGELDAHGHVKVIDRKKDIFITVGGKNITPSEIENRLKFSPYIRDAILIGDGRRYLAALIGIEEDAVGDWATRRGVPYTTYRDLTERREVVELIDQEVRRVNAALASVEQVKRFRLLPKRLDHEDQELTATQKVRRRAISERFAELIEAMYGEGAQAAKVS
jgi:long-chain acyl-CoA synthetase